MKKTLSKVLLLSIIVCLNFSCSDKDDDNNQKKENYGTIEFNGTTYTITKLDRIDEWTNNQIRYWLLTKEGHYLSVGFGGIDVNDLYNNEYNFFSDGDGPASGYYWVWLEHRDNYDIALVGGQYFNQKNGYLKVSGSSANFTITGEFDAYYDKVIDEDDWEHTYEGKKAKIQLKLVP